MLGSVSPIWRTVIPWANRGAASNKPETNWDDAEASISTMPPMGEPLPETLNGRLSP